MPEKAIMLSIVSLDYSNNTNNELMMHAGVDTFQCGMSGVLPLAAWLRG